MKPHELEEALRQWAMDSRLDRPMLVIPGIDRVGTPLQVFPADILELLSPPPPVEASPEFGDLRY